MKKLVSLIALGAMLAGTAAAHAADKLTLELKWVTQAQFAGYYVAKAKGYYTDADLDVTINPSGTDVTPVQALAAGGADVIVDWLADALASREKGVKLVNIAQPYKSSGLWLTCRKDMGVNSTDDFKGKTLGVWFGGNEYPFYAWMAKLDLPTNGGADGVTVLKQGFDVNPLLQKQAADTLKRCTMELGGHAPVIVYEDADLERTLDTVVAFKFRNAGQVCTSPTRFYVHEAVYDRFIDGFATRAEKLRIGDGLDTNVQMGPMIAPRRLEAMDAFVSDATAKGAAVVTGGKRIGNKGYFYAPTLLKDVPDTARIMFEEPFGPIAPTTPFSTFDDMIERANSLPYGLASFVFTRNLSLAQKTEAALEAGMVGVNHMMVSTPETPFGGVNESGYGSESGIEGLDAYLRTKFVTEM